MKYGVDTPDFPQGCAIVFGGSGGLGMGIAGLLAQRGSDILITYRSQERKAHDFVREQQGMGRRAEAMQCDARDLAQVRAVYERAAQSFGRIHSVVSAGGMTFNTGPMEHVDPKQFRDVIDTDVIGFFNIAHVGIPLMRSTKGGSIVAVTTCATERTLLHDTLSAAPKSAVNMLVRQIAIEEGPNGIRANAVGSGAINTGLLLSMTANAINLDTINLCIQNTPLRRLGLTEEFAEAAAFLASSRASYINGQVLMVDGGLSL